MQAETESVEDVLDDPEVLQLGDDLRPRLALFAEEHD
jgi:hypothetical protein